MNTQPDDHRTSTRAATERRARVRLRSGLGGVFEARVVDIAPFGLRLLCPVGLALGDELEIEVYPRDGVGEAIGVRGEVRHVGVTKGGHEAGVKLMVTLGALPLQAEGMRVEMEALRRALAGLGAGATTQLTFHPEEANDPQKDSEPEPSSRRSRLRWGVLLLLVLLAGTMLWYRFPSAATKGLRQAGHVGEGRVYHPQTGTPQGAVMLEPADDPVSRGWEALHLPSLTAETPEIVEALSRPTADPDDTYVKGLLVAQLRLGEGDRAGASTQLAALESLEEAGTAPAAWRLHAERLRLAAAGGDLAGLAVPLPMLAVGSSAEVVAGAPLPQEHLGVVTLDIDTSSYTMEVRQGDAVLARFPVGLGAKDSTPLGKFAIRNKIENPDWYHRGASVPHGHPDNPLGNHWLGLTPDGVGIHPTEDADSIGGNESRGCIRMFPEDAAKVFGWCQPGTVVFIHR